MIETFYEHERQIMKDPLFEPIFINSTEIKNRIYMPAMHLNMAFNYEVTDRLTAFYAERAKGGAGMIVVGYATIDENSGNAGNIGAHKDEFIPGLKRLANAIKSNGARSAVQLNHAGRYNFSFFMDGRQPVAPSAVASKMTHETPKALEIDEIKEIIRNFASAAGRVKEAGFDAVEILSGTGYLISEFLSPLTNLRDDEYGGPIENRMRFGLEVMDAVKAEVGASFPLIVRMNGNEFMRGGSSPDDLRKYAVNLVKHGVDAICVNVGWHEARVPQILTEVPRGVFGYLARGIKEQVDVPVIASHRINDPDLAREMISDGMCDMAALGRSLIADPYFPYKAQNGREKDIVHCVACAQGCFDHLFQLKHVECLCNPMAGHECELNVDVTDAPKKVLVAGGGAAGMSAAMGAFRKGHDVVLYEKSDILGGQLLLAGAPPGREEFKGFADDLAAQLAASKIKTVMNTEVTPDIIEKEKPDHVILATGAVPLAVPIEGADLPHVLQAWDVLSGKTFTGKDVVIIGGGAVGVETALYLSEKGTLSAEGVKFLLVNRAETPEMIYEMAVNGTKNITVIEMLDKIGKDIGKSTKWAMFQDVRRRKIRTQTGTKAVKITSEGVIVDNNGETVLMKADTVVIAAGSKPYNPLKETLEQMGIPMSSAGDAEKIGKAFDAVHMGFKAGMMV